MHDKRCKKTTVYVHIATEQEKKIHSLLVPCTILSRETKVILSHIPLHTVQVFLLLLIR